MRNGQYVRIPVKTATYSGSNTAAHSGLKSATYTVESHQHAAGEPVM